jgi:hypothetical protein
MDPRPDTDSLATLLTLGVIALVMSALDAEMRVVREKPPTKIQRLKSGMARIVRSVRTPLDRRNTAPPA